MITKNAKVVRIFLSQFLFLLLTTDDLRFLGISPHGYFYDLIGPVFEGESEDEIEPKCGTAFVRT